MSALLAAALALVAPPVPVTVQAEEVRVAAGGTVEARVRVMIRPGFHVQANPPAEEFLVPLTVDLPEAPPVRVGLPVYPPGRPHRLRGATLDLLTYEGAVSVRVPLRVERDGASSRVESVVLRGSLRYQACDDRVCLRPATAPLRLAVRVSGQGTPSDHAPE
jgi:DsbC/DsbD-like thiol-disulfide interchange protein